MRVLVALLCLSLTGCYQVVASYCKGDVCATVKSRKNFAEGYSFRYETVCGEGPDAPCGPTIVFDTGASTVSPSPLEQVGAALLLEAARKID